MTPYNRIFQLHDEGKNNTEISNVIGDVSRKTVITVLQLAEKMGFVYPSDQSMSDIEIHRALHPRKLNADRVPDMERALYTVGLPGMSVAKAWGTYCDDCKRKGISPYSKAQFQNMVNDSKKRIAVPEYKPMLVFRYIANAINDGELSYGLLAAEMMGSRYIVTTLISDKKSRTWIHGITDILRQLNCIPKECCFMGHLPASVSARTEDCLQYYGAIIKKYDKRIQTCLPEFMEWIIRRCRERETTLSSSFTVKSLCHEYDVVSFFESGSFSVKDAFLLERDILQKLPEDDYDLVEFMPVSPRFNHVQIDNMYYSVPFEYRHEKLVAYVSDELVEIHNEGTVVCVHDRLTGWPGKYRTEAMHLPDDKDIPWDETSGKSLRLWADKIGPYTRKTIDYWLKKVTFEAQAYKICSTVLHMSSKYTSWALESVCKEAWGCNEVSYHFIAERLKNGK